MGSNISLPKTIWPGLLALFLWCIYCTMKANAIRIPTHGSASSTYVSCILYAHTRLPSTWCILYIVSFACGFLGGYFLVLIPYSFSIKLFLNLWPSNSPPWSYVIYTDHGYRTSHVVSSNFAIGIAFLSLYCITLNHSVTGSIVVTYFNIRGSFLLLHLLYIFFRVIWDLHIVYSAVFLPVA